MQCYQQPSRLLIGLASILWFAAAAPVVAKARGDYLGDAAIEQAKLCTQHFARQERLYGIPTHLLAAISATESGRWNDKLGMVLPWPWTMNANGKGYYFRSKSEAIAKARSLQAQGIKSMDIGCMQVNLKHHPRAFANLEQAFDPVHNVAYAAQFLRRNYEDLNSWTKAAGAYHSRTPKHGNRYLALVEKAWNAITGKVRMAKTYREEWERERRSFRVIKVSGNYEPNTQLAPLSAQDQQELGGNEPTSGQALFNRNEQLTTADRHKVSPRRLNSQGKSAGQGSFGKSLRDVDRMSRGVNPRMPAYSTSAGRSAPASQRSIRYINVREVDERQARPVVIRPYDRNRTEKLNIREAPQVVAAAATPLVDAATKLVDDYRDDANKSNAPTVSLRDATAAPSGPRVYKPKFVFVD